MLLKLVYFSLVIILISFVFLATPVFIYSFDLINLYGNSWLPLSDLL